MAGKQVKSYESIIEKLNREYGESYRADFQSDKVTFFPKMKLTDAQQELYSSPVGGRKPFKPGPDDKEEFSDANAQLELRPSSTIQSAAYWKNRQYLVVSFKSGHTYSYIGVPLEIIIRWEQAGSAGSFFYYNIRTSFGYQKLG